MSDHVVALVLIAGVLALVTGSVVWCTLRAMQDDGFGAYRDSGGRQTGKLQATRKK
jgi:hypothetical protein